ncbi:MAG TPA: zf-HC2 domain-containing protein, partial [Ktedonobacterales bacterium]
MDSRDARFERGDLAHPAEGAAPTPECGRIAPLLEAFYDDALEAGEARRVAGHLAGCAYCTARLRRYEAVDQLVRAAPAPVAGPALRARLYRAIAAASGDGARRTDMAAGTALAERERDGASSWPGRSFSGGSLPGRSLAGGRRPVAPR